MKHGRLRHIGDGAFEASDRRGDALVGFEQHGGVVVDVDIGRKTLDQLAVEIEGAGVIARALALVRLREKLAHFVGRRGRGLGGAGRSLRGLIHETMASGADGNGLILAKRR